MSQTSSLGRTRVERGIYRQPNGKYAVCPHSQLESACLIAILADTHMPRGARRLPARCVELITAAEAVIHAGDFFAASALEEVRTLCPVVHAVHGNVDEAPLRRLLPAKIEDRRSPDEPRY